jgi:hypothetical protein
MSSDRGDAPAGNLGTTLDGAVMMGVNVNDVLCAPETWRKFDCCDGTTSRGIHFTIVHEVADAFERGEVVHREWYHRLTVACDDPACCPEPVMFAGVDAWHNACAQLQDLLSFLHWR